MGVNNDSIKLFITIWISVNRYKSGVKIRFLKAYKLVVVVVIVLFVK